MLRSTPTARAVLLFFLCFTSLFVARVHTDISGRHDGTAARISVANSPVAAKYEWTKSYPFIGESTIHDMIEIEESVFLVGEYKGLLSWSPELPLQVTNRSTAFVACMSRTNGTLRWAAAPFTEPATIGFESSFEHVAAWPERQALLVAGTSRFGSAYHTAVLMAFNTTNGLVVASHQQACLNCSQLRVADVALAAGRLLLTGTFRGHFATNCSSNDKNSSSFVLSFEATTVDISSRNATYVLGCNPLPSEIHSATAGNDYFLVAGVVSGMPSFNLSPHTFQPESNDSVFFVAALAPDDLSIQWWVNSPLVNDSASVVHVVAANDTAFVVWPQLQPKVEAFNLTIGEPLRDWLPLQLSADVSVQRLNIMQGALLVLAEVQGVAELGPGLRVQTIAQGFVARLGGGGRVEQALALPSVTAARRGPQLLSAGSTHLLVAGTYRWRNRSEADTLLPELALAALDPSPLWPSATPTPSSSTPPSTTATTATLSTAPSSASPTSSAPPTTTEATASSSPTTTSTTAPSSTTPTSTPTTKPSHTRPPSFDESSDEPSGSSVSMLLIYAVIIGGVGTAVWYAWKRCSTAPAYSSALQQTESDL